MPGVDYKSGRGHRAVICVWRLFRIESPDILWQELVDRSQEAMNANQSKDIAAIGLQIHEPLRVD